MFGLHITACYDTNIKNMTSIDQAENILGIIDSILIYNNNISADIQSSLKSLVVLSIKVF